MVEKDCAAGQRPKSAELGRKRSKRRELHRSRILRSTLKCFQWFGGTELVLNGVIIYAKEPRFRANEREAIRSGEFGDDPRDPWIGFGRISRPAAGIEGIDCHPGAMFCNGFAEAILVGFGQCMLVFIKVGLVLVMQEVRRGRRANHEQGTFAGNDVSILPGIARGKLFIPGCSRGAGDGFVVEKARLAQEQYDRDQRPFGCLCRWLSPTPQSPAETCTTRDREHLWKTEIGRCLLVQFAAGDQ